MNVPRRRLPEDDGTAPDIAGQDMLELLKSLSPPASAGGGGMASQLPSSVLSALVQQMFAPKPSVETDWEVPGVLK